MDDERTWEDQQDSLDYRQWKAEQDAERANRYEQEPVVLTQAQQVAMVSEVASLRLQVAELEEALYEALAQQELWKPLEDGTYTAEAEYRFGPTMIIITGDLVEVANTNFRLRDDFRLCRRIED